MQILVPARGPDGGRAPPVHGIREEHLRLSVGRQNHGCLVGAVGAKLPSTLDHLRVAGRRLHHDTDNTVPLLRGARGQLVVIDEDVVVVVEPGDRVGPVGVGDLAQREALRVELEFLHLVLVEGGGREPVDQPIDVVVLVDAVVDKVCFPRIKLFDLTQALAGLVLGHVDLEGRVENAVAEEDRPERLGDLFGAIFGAAEVEGGVVVVEGEHGAQLLVCQREGGGEAVDV